MGAYIYEDKPSSIRCTYNKKRRTYSAEFKQQIVQACKVQGVSIASVALQHGLNINLVSKRIFLIGTMLIIRE